MESAIPPGFGPIFRTSPLLDALGSFYSKGAGASLEVGLLVTERHTNARGTVHGGVLATLADVGIGYLMAYSGDPPHRLTTASLNIDYTGTARIGDWIRVEMDAPRIGRQLAFANARLMTGERQVARASAVFAVAPA
ncbi:MAG: PaaI family thioesterase [Burkholderiales bacterium]|nr:PaaI family thioesterase [Burkholderiales bacterium]